MSGGGGGGAYGAGGGRSSDCKIVERVQLNSPKPDVVKQIAVGHTLNVELSDDQLSVVAKTTAGKVAGSLTPASLAELIRCIKSGHKYKADVLMIRGARVDLELRPK